MGKTGDLHKKYAMQTNKPNLIVDLTFNFAVEIVNYTDSLIELKKYNLAHQCEKAGTSIGANVREAQNAESPADFIHKLKIAAKEADETDYWLSICKKSKGYPHPDQLLKMCTDISKVLSKIISTSKFRYKK